MYDNKLIFLHRFFKATEIRLRIVKIIIASYAALCILHLISILIFYVNYLNYYAKYQ